jgi:hypothetical protein
VTALVLLDPSLMLKVLGEAESMKVGAGWFPLCLAAVHPHSSSANNINADFIAIGLILGILPFEFEYGLTLVLQP